MLNDLKLLLGISSSDSSLDTKLKRILFFTEQRLSLLLGGIEEIPSELEHIVVEVSVIRYNKIGSEGVSSHTVEGESMSFNDDDFAGYQSEIQAYIDANKASKRGRVVFI